MTDLRKAAEQALEALENIDRWLPTIGQRGLRDYEADAIQALRQALAQPEQEQKTPLKVLNLTVFTENRLRNGRVYDVETLQAMTNRDILAIPDMGKKALAEVLEALNAHAVNISQERVDETAKGGHDSLGSEWAECVKLPIVVHVRKQRDGETHISTREGITPVLSDDLIMRGVAGEEYPIGRELFERTYTFDTAPPKRGCDNCESLRRAAWDRINELEAKLAEREWVGLTDDEIIKCFDSVAFGQVEDDLIINKHVNIFTAIHYIEAKLKEKNT